MDINSSIYLSVGSLKRKQRCGSVESTRSTSIDNKRTFQNAMVSISSESPLNLAASLSRLAAATPKAKPRDSKNTDSFARHPPKTCKVLSKFK